MKGKEEDSRFFFTSKTITTWQKQPKKQLKKQHQKKQHPKRPLRKKQLKKQHRKKAARKKAGGAANSAFMAPVSISGDLAKIVGKDSLPRTEIVKKIWDYIKKHDLQDKKNRRMINADEQLKVVFKGKDQISMFELAKVVNNHVK